jgi:uncharacterized protein
VKAEPPSSRTKVRRMPARAIYAREAIDAILDEALVAHVGLLEDGQPYVIPTLHARVGDVVYFHGSAASRTIRALASGAPACLTVMLLDGLVLARSAVHHSVNYRSVVVLGSASLVEGQDERAQALRAFTERLVPGRWDEVRPPTDRELAGVRVLAMRLDEVSAKVRTGPPLDDPEDYTMPVWAGIIPLGVTAGKPIADAKLPAGIAPSSTVTGWSTRRSEQIHAVVSNRSRKIGFGAMPALTVYEKPTCTTCRNLHALLTERGVDFESVEYHVTGLTEEELRELLRKLDVGPREILRTREPLVKELGLDRPEVSDEELIARMVEHPVLVQRPIVVRGERAVLARPVERVLELL